jgi:hypothetical protein
MYNTEMHVCPLSSLLLKILNTNHHLHFKNKFITYHKISGLKLQYLKFPGIVWRTLQLLSLIKKFLVTSICEIIHSSLSSLYFMLVYVAVCLFVEMFVS